MTKDIFLFIHIIGVLGLFIALSLQWLCLIEMRRARAVVQIQEWAGLRGVLAIVFPISAVVILISGLYLVHEMGGDTPAWAGVALIVLILLGVAAGVLSGPKMRAISEAADAAPAGAVPGSLSLLILDPILWTTVQVSGTLAIGLVYLMTIKPATGGSWLTILVAAVIGAVASQPVRRARMAVKVTS
jgi:hypothetical protein